MIKSRQSSEGSPMGIGAIIRTNTVFVFGFFFFFSFFIFHIKWLAL